MIKSIGQVLMINIWNQISLQSKRFLPGPRTFKSSLSIGLSLLMLMPLLSWAVDPGTYLQSGRPYLLMNQKVVSVPRQFGAVEQAYEAPNSRGVVIHIQDLHCHYEVQSNIAHILKDLSRRLGVALIGVEGSGRLINTSKLGTFPLDQAKKAVGRYLMKQGLISGAEYFSALSSKPLLLEGVEDEGLYLKNLKTARSFLNSESLGYCADLKEILGAIKTRYYRQPMLALEKLVQNYKEGRCSQADFAGRLWQTAKSYGLDLAPFPQIFRYLQQQKSSYVTGINPDQLQEEIGRLDQALAKALVSTPREAAINDVGQRLEVMEKLLSIAANHREVRDFMNHRDQYRAATLLKSMAQWAPQETTMMMPDGARLQTYLDDVARFYNAADERSARFVANLSMLMQQHKQKAAVLITGGYHAPDVLAALKQAGYSYISVVPRLSHQDLINPYFQLIQDKKTPLETLLLQNQKLIAPPIRNFQLPRTSLITSTQPLSEETLQTMMAQLPDGLRDNIKSLEAMQQLLLWQQAMLERLHQAQSENRLSEGLESLQHRYVMDDRRLEGVQSQDFELNPAQLQRLFEAVKSGRSMVLPMGNTNLCLVAGPARQLRPLTQLPYVVEAHGLAASVISSAQEGAVEQQLKQIAQKAGRPWVVIGRAVKKWWREKPLSASVTQMASLFLPLAFYHGSWSWHGGVDFWPSLVITAAIIIALAVMDWQGTRPTRRESAESLRDQAPGVTPYENWPQKLVSMVLLPIAESGVITLMVTGLSFAFLPKTSVLVEHFFHSTFQITDPWLAVPLLILFSKLLNDLFAKNFFGDLHRAKGEDVVKAVNQAGTRTWWITWGLLLLSLMGVSVAPHASLAEVIWQVPESFMYYLISTFGLIYLVVHTTQHIIHNSSAPPEKRWTVGVGSRDEKFRERDHREALLLNLMAIFLKVNLKNPKGNQMDSLLTRLNKRKTSSAKLKVLLQLAANMSRQESQTRKIDEESLEDILWKTYWEVVKDQFLQISWLPRTRPGQVNNDDLLKLLAAMPDSIWQDIQTSTTLSQEWHLWAENNISVYFSRLMLEMDAVVNPIYTSSDAPSAQTMQDLNTLLQEAYRLALKYPDLEGRLQRLVAVGKMVVNYVDTPATHPLADRLKASITATYNAATPDLDPITNQEVKLITPFFDKSQNVEDARDDYIEYQLLKNNLLFRDYEELRYLDVGVMENDLLRNWETILWHQQHMQGKIIRQVFMERVLRQYQTYTSIKFGLHQPPRPLQFQGKPLEAIAASELQPGSLFVINAPLIKHILGSVYDNLLGDQGDQKRFVYLYDIVIANLNKFAPEIMSLVAPENRMEAWLAWMDFLAILPPVQDGDLPPRQNAGVIEGLDFIKTNIGLTWKACSSAYKKKNEERYNTLWRLMEADQNQLADDLKEIMGSVKGLGDVMMPAGSAQLFDNNVNIPHGSETEEAQVILDNIFALLSKLLKHKHSFEKLDSQNKPALLGRLFLLSLQIKNAQMRYFYLHQLAVLAPLATLAYHWKNEYLGEMVVGHEEKYRFQNPFEERLMQWALPVGLTALLGLSGLFYSPAPMAAGVGWKLASSVGVMPWVACLVIIAVGLWEYFRIKHVERSLAQSLEKSNDQEHSSFESAFEAIKDIGRQIDEGEVSRADAQAPLVKNYQLALEPADNSLADVELDRLMQLGWSGLFYLEEPYNREFARTFRDRLSETYKRFKKESVELPSHHYLLLRKEISLLQGFYSQDEQERHVAARELNQEIENFIRGSDFLRLDAKQEGLQQLWPLLRLYFIYLRPSVPMSEDADWPIRSQYNYFKKIAKERGVSLPPIRVEGKTIEELLELDKHPDGERTALAQQIQRIRERSQKSATAITWENNPEGYKSQYNALIISDPEKALSKVLSDIKQAKLELTDGQAEGTLGNLIAFMLDLLGQTQDRKLRRRFANELKTYLYLKGIDSGRVALDQIINLSKLTDGELEEQISKGIKTHRNHPMALLETAYKALAIENDNLRQQMLKEILSQIQVAMQDRTATLGEVLGRYLDKGVDLEHERAVSENLPDHLAFLERIKGKRKEKPQSEKTGISKNEQVTSMAANVRLKNYLEENPILALTELRSLFDKTPAIGLQLVMEKLCDFIERNEPKYWNVLSELILRLLGQTRDSRLRLNYAKQLRKLLQREETVLGNDSKKYLDILILLSESNDAQLEALVRKEMETEKNEFSDYIETMFMIFAIHDEKNREELMRQLTKKIYRVAEEEGKLVVDVQAEFLRSGIDLTTEQLVIDTLPKPLFFLTFRDGQDGPGTESARVLPFAARKNPPPALLLTSLGLGLLGLGHSKAPLASPLTGLPIWSMDFNAWLWAAAAGLVVGWGLAHWWKGRSGRVGLTALLGLSALFFYSPPSMAAGVDWVLVSTVGVPWLVGLVLLAGWLVYVIRAHSKKTEQQKSPAQVGKRKSDQEHFSYEDVFETIEDLGRKIDEGKVEPQRAQAPLAEYYQTALNLPKDPSVAVELDRLMQLGWSMLFYLEEPYNHDFIQAFRDRLSETYARYEAEQAYVETLHVIPLEQELPLLQGLYSERYLNRLKAGLQLNQIITNFMGEHSYLPSGAQQEGLQQLWPLMRIYLTDLQPSPQVSQILDRQARSQYHFFKQKALEWAITLPPIRVNGNTIEKLLEVGKHKDLEPAGDEMKIERITVSNGLALEVKWENSPEFYKAYYDVMFREEPAKVLTYVLSDIKKAKHETLDNQAEGELRELINYMLTLLGQTGDHGMRGHFALELRDYLQREAVLTGCHSLDLIITLSSSLKDEQLQSQIKEKLAAVAPARPMALLDSAYKALALVDDKLRQRMLEEILTKIKAMISGTSFTLELILEWYHDGGVDLENAQAVSEKLPDYLAFLKPPDRTYGEQQPTVEPKVVVKTKNEAAYIGSTIQWQFQWSNNPDAAEREIRTKFIKHPAIALQRAMEELNISVAAGPAESFAKIKLNALINLILELLGRTRDEQLRLTYAKKLRDMQQQKKDILDKDREEALNTLILLTESTDEELETMINAELETKKEYPSDYIEATFKIFAIRNQGKREAFLEQMVEKINKLIRPNKMTPALEYQKYSNVGIDLANKGLNLFGLPKHLLFLTYRSGQDGPEGPETKPENVILFPSNGHSSAILLASLGLGLLGLVHSQAPLAGTLNAVPPDWIINPFIVLLIIMVAAALAFRWFLRIIDRRPDKADSSGESLIDKIRPFVVYESSRGEKNKIIPGLAPAVHWYEGLDRFENYINNLFVNQPGKALTFVMSEIKSVLNEHSMEQRQEVLHGLIVYMLALLMHTAANNKWMKFTRDLSELIKVNNLDPLGHYKRSLVEIAPEMRGSPNAAPTQRLARRSIGGPISFQWPDISGQSRQAIENSFPRFPRQALEAVMKAFKKSAANPYFNVNDDPLNKVLIEFILKLLGQTANPPLRLQIAEEFQRSLAEKEISYDAEALATIIRLTESSDEELGQLVEQEIKDTESYLDFGITILTAFAIRDKDRRKRVLNDIKTRINHLAANESVKQGQVKQYYLRKGIDLKKYSLNPDRLPDYLKFLGRSQNESQQNAKIVNFFRDGNHSHLILLASLGFGLMGLTHSKATLAGILYGRMFTGDWILTYGIPLAIVLLGICVFRWFQKDNSQPGNAEVATVPDYAALPYRAEAADHAGVAEVPGQAKVTEKSLIDDTPPSIVDEPERAQKVVTVPGLLTPQVYWKDGPDKFKNDINDLFEAEPGKALTFVMSEIKSVLSKPSEEQNQEEIHGLIVYMLELLMCTEDDNKQIKFAQDLHELIEEHKLDPVGQYRRALKMEINPEMKSSPNMAATAPEGADQHSGEPTQFYWPDISGRFQEGIEELFSRSPDQALGLVMKAFEESVDDPYVKANDNPLNMIIIEFILELLGQTTDPKLRLQAAENFKRILDKKKITSYDNELATIIGLSKINSDEELVNLVEKETSNIEAYSDFKPALLTAFAIRNENTRKNVLNKIKIKIYGLARQKWVIERRVNEQYLEQGIDLKNNRLSYLPPYLSFLEMPLPGSPKMADVIPFHKKNDHPLIPLLVSSGFGLLLLGHSRIPLAAPLDGSLAWGMEPNAWLLWAAAAGLAVGWVLVRWWKKRQAGKTVATEVPLSRRLNTPYRRNGFKAIVNVAGWIMGVFSPLLMTSIQSWKSLIHRRGKQLSREESLGPQHYFRSRIYKRILMNKMTGPWLGGAFLDRLLAAVILRVDGRTYWQTAAGLVSAGTAGPFDKLVLAPRQGLLAQLQARPGLTLAQRREELVRGLARIMRDHADEIDREFMLRAQELLALSAPLATQRLGFYEGRALRLPKMMWSRGLEAAGGTILDGLRKYLGADVIWDNQRVDILVHHKPQQSVRQGV